MSDGRWEVNSVRIEGSDLVIDAQPSYGNKKKWQGEMTFRVDEADLQSLQDQLADRDTKGKMVEIAEAEMKEYLTEVKKEYFEKRRTVAKQLNIDVADMPDPWTSSFFDDENRQVEFE